MLVDLYKNLEQYEYTLTLCKPNKEELVILSEAYEIVYRAKFGDIDELSFKIPSKVQDTVSRMFIDNPNYDLIKGDFLIHMQTSLVDKYFIIDTPKEAEGDIDSKDIQCLSLETELNKKNIRNFKGTRQIYHRPEDVVETGEGILNLLEETTTWRIGFVDPLVYEERTYLYEEAKFITSFNPTERLSIHNKYRTFDVTEDNWMNFIRSEIEPAFDCIFLFDTVNRLVNVYHIDTLSQDRGLYISKDNYLKNINIEPKFGEIYTRIRVYGKDNITINSKNPLGTDYIEDFSYYMDNGYMSDSLVSALNAYNDLLALKGTEFNTLLDELSLKEEVLLQLQTEMSTLLSEKIILLDTKDSQIMQGADLSSVNILIAAKEQQIADKQAQIDSCNGEITTIQNNITALRDVIDKKNNFTTEQLTELDYFTKGKSWQNNNYDDVDALYESGKQALKKLITPTLSYGIDIADLLDIVDCKLEWNKVINLGNIIHVETRKNIVDQRLVGYTHSVGKSLTVDCSNKERLDSPERYLTDSIGQAISGARTVYAKKFMWDLSEQNGDWINNIINNNFDASRYAVVANDQAIRIDERGILLSSMDKSDLNIVRMLNNIIVMSQDGGQTYSLALTGQGIVAEKLIGRILAGTNLVIANEANNVSIDANGFTLKDSQYKTLISPQGVASSDNISFLDSVDADNSLIMDFFIDDNVNVIDKVLLKLSVLDFRSYVKGSSAGGGKTYTSRSGGGSTSGASSKSSETSGQTSKGDSGYIITTTEYVDTEPGVTGHYHHINNNNWNHTHILDFSHTHQISSHSHYLDVEDHSHNLIPGIYTNPKTINTMNIYIDGVLRTSVASEKNIIDISQYVTVKGWHQISITSSALNRYSASIYIKSYIGA